MTKHAKNRARERLGVDLLDVDIATIAMRCFVYDTLSCRESSQHNKDTEAHVLFYRRVKMSVIYDRANHSIVTVMPNDATVFTRLTLRPETFGPMLSKQRKRG